LIACVAIACVSGKLLAGAAGMSRQGSQQAVCARQCGAAALPAAASAAEAWASGGGAAEGAATWRGKEGSASWAQAAHVVRAAANVVSMCGQCSKCCQSCWLACLCGKLSACAAGMGKPAAFSALQLLLLLHLR
jgi:hypothetical protein